MLLKGLTCRAAIGGTTPRLLPRAAAAAAPAPAASAAAAVALLLAVGEATGRGLETGLPAIVLLLKRRLRRSRLSRPRRPRLPSLSPRSRLRCVPPAFGVLRYCVVGPFLPCVCVCVQGMHVRHSHANAGCERPSG